MLPEVVAEAARRFGPTAAFVDSEGRATSYDDLHRRSLAVAAGLAARGAGLGDVVALTLPSTIEYVLAYIGVATVGAITAGVNPRLAAIERERCVAVAGPALEISTAEQVLALEATGAA